MAKGKSEYTIQFNCDSNAVNTLIQSYLQANGFQIYEKKGEQYYRAGDQMLGYRGFTYTFNGQNLIINAWLDGALGDFKLEQNNMMAVNYRNSLGTLFNEISKLNNGGVNMNNEINGQVPNQNGNNNQMNYDPNTGQPINQNNFQQPVQNNANQFAQTFQDETNKRKEKLCEIGFWLSILGVLGALGGVAMGLLVYIMDFYFASQGLKTKKRGKAIATIVLSIISILITILQLMSA